MSDLTSTPDITLPTTSTTHSDHDIHKDIVLRSADDVLFNVTRHDLERTSSWFRAQISDNNASEEISVSEDAVMLELVLKLSLELEPETEVFASIETHEAALVATKKYGMNKAAKTVLSHLRSTLLESNDPLLEYAVARRHKIADLQKTAFERCTRMDIDFAHLHGLQADDLAQIVTARTKHIKDIHAVLVKPDSTWDPCYYPNLGTCPCCRGVLSQYARTTWEEFVKALMCRSLDVPSIEDLLMDPEVRPAYEALLGTPCPNHSNRLPFSQIREKLVGAVKQRENRRPGSFKV